MKSAQQMLATKASGVVTVSPDTSVFDALKLMAEKDIGAVVVLDGPKLVGIFTERDYARKVILSGKSSMDTLVREIMTNRVLCVTPAQMADECMEIMTHKRCRHLPVVEDKRVIGILSIGDLVKEVISEQRETIIQLESYIMS
jgi:CBS domain-containing protein